MASISHPEAKTERQYLLQLQGLLHHCHPSAVWCQLQGYLGLCWFPWLWIWLWHLQWLTHVIGYTGWIHQAPSTGTTTKWHWGYSILLHRGWRIHPTSAHAKAFLRAIPGQWPARLQLPAVTCQTGCRKPLWYHGKPIRCLLSTLEVTPEKAVSITKACLTLHNLLHERYGVNNIGADEEDENNEVIPGQWRTDTVMHEVDAQLRTPFANAAGQALRTTFQHYFNSNAGSVPRQLRVLGLEQRNERN